MSLKPEVILAWADGEYLFRLNGREIEELEKICGVGIGAIYQRVSLGVYYWKDIYNSVRLGLIGGGMGAVEAKQKADMYVGREKAAYPFANGPDSPEQIAAAVIRVFMHGFEDLPPGEAEAPKT